MAIRAAESRAADLPSTIARDAMRWVVALRRHPRSGRTIRDIKRLSEFAIAAYVVDHYRAPQVGMPRSFTRRMVADCWIGLDSGEAVRRFVDRAPMWGILVTTYVPFFRSGLRNERLERSFERVLSTTEFEEVDYAILVDAAQRLLGGTVGRAPARRRAWPARWVNGALTVHDAYMLAHAVFYETDFGRKPNGLAPANRHAVARRLPTLCERFIRSRQYDILAELALAAACVGLRVSIDVWKALRSAQRGDGSVPFNRRRRSARDYHSTLAALMAAAACCGAAGASARRARSRPRTRPARGPARSL